MISIIDVAIAPVKADAGNIPGFSASRTWQAEKVNKIMV